MNIRYFALDLFAFCSCGINYADDRSEPVAWIESDISSKFIYQYTDSVPGASWNSPPDSLGSVHFGQEYNSDIVRVQSYYFPEPHEEIYRVKFTWPMVIESVYSDSAQQVLLKKDMSVNEVERVEARFKREILEPMVKWGRKKGVADSVMFW
jgi:hypothetical protein